MVVTGLIVGIVRSERIADWIGRTGQRATEWVMRRLKRTGAPDVAGAIHKFRDQLGLVIRRRGASRRSASPSSPSSSGRSSSSSPSGSAAFPPTCCLASVVFGVYALVMCITIIPLSPGGAGVSEILFISAFTTIAGTGYEAAITAGVFLYRMYFWFVPIPLAWILMKVARGGKPILPTTSELRDYAKGEPA